MIFAPVTMEDANDIFRWANDPVTRAYSFSSEQIVWEKHVIWLKNKIEDPQSIFLIVKDEYNHTKYGLLRLEESDEGFIQISYSVAPEYRRLGIGSKLVSEIDRIALEKFGECTLIAEVKLENLGSRRCFEKNDYSICYATESEIVFSKRIMHDSIQN